ncbi:FtsW/RodA/SpoVE family cell cycle protein [Clostridium sp. 19966]|uniref:FtsW/RodA/SpoVE family cell cycle protein n=1 Tax=Clostridium sp. 19966 TaxID=2768166 RepID=UPI0028DF135D|nr:FtsW/RodA/SpoVE family cell cycle protein [Clostridium sp. 19966]MDT8717731.1 FtsW/RodA/SpoVE family cell cycle protein [Clostridium sp. 19966]
MLNHIEEKTDELTYQNMTEEEAYSRAISEMGEADIIGRELNKTHKAAPEWSILIITILFTFIGLIAMISIVVSGVNTSLDEGYLIKTAVFTLLSYAFLAALYFFDYKILEKYAIKIFVGTTFILFLQLFIALPMHGVRNWLYIGPFSIDMGEISLFLFGISLPKLLDEFKGKGVKGRIIILAALFVPTWLYISLSVTMGALIYFAMFFMLMIILKFKPYFMVIILGLAFLGILWVTNSNTNYFINRLASFMNIKSDGYMYNQLRTLLKQAGLFGNGFTFPKAAVPSLESDFIFTYIIYTFGLIAGIIVIALILSFIGRMFLASKAVKDSYGKLIIQSFMCIFTIEFIWYVLMTAGLAPIVGITLPFISYGSSKLVIQMIAIGLIMSIYKGKSLSYIEEDMGKEKIES